MSDLIKADLNNDRFEIYEELLLKRDRLRREAGSIKISYLKEFGDLISEEFELKIECIKLKKMISFAQQYINRGEKVDINSMNEAIDREMAAYYDELKDITLANSIAKDSKTSPYYKVDRARRIYRRIAKKIHPDMFPDMKDDEELMDLWNRVVRAYNANDDDELLDIEVLIRRYLEENGYDRIIVRIDDLDDRIARLEKEIADIIETEPYTLKKYLESDEMKEAKKQEISEAIREYREYKKNLENILNDILGKGGATLVWQMN